MKDYKDFPPIRYFIRVLKSCPQAAFLYLQVWEKRGKYMRLNVHKKSVRKEYLISPTMFRNLLSPLMLLNLISFEESDEEFQIDISGCNDNE